MALIVHQSSIERVEKLVYLLQRFASDLTMGYPCVPTLLELAAVWKPDTGWAFKSRLALSDQNPIMELQTVDATRTILVGGSLVKLHRTPLKTEPMPP